MTKQVLQPAIWKKIQFPKNLAWLHYDVSYIGGNYQKASAAQLKNTYQE